MLHLLDTNVIIARMDPGHQFHSRVSAWMRATRQLRIATTAITELGFLRIYGHPKYIGGPGSPAGAALDLSLLRSFPGHAFLADSPSIIGDNLVTDLTPVSPRQLTDLYLLALAVRHKTRFVTLDEKIPAHLVKGGSAFCVVIP